MPYSETTRASADAEVRASSSSPKRSSPVTSATAYTGAGKRATSAADPKAACASTSPDSSPAKTSTAHGQPASRTG